MLTRSELKTLMDVCDTDCVSIYLPTHRMGADTQGDATRLKNLLKTATELLTARGMRSPDIQHLLKPARDLLPQKDFWQHQLGGLALFLTPEHVDHYRVPFAFEPLAVVSDSLHLKPLMPLLSGDGRFFVLALSQDTVQIYEGTRFSAHPLEIQDLPESLVTLLDEEDRERSMQFHTRTTIPARWHAASTRPAMFHSHGGNESDTTPDILRYFRELDAALQPLLADTSAPLVLAGVEFLHPLYRQASSYPHILDAGILGSPKSLDVETLHREAWDIVAPRFRAEEQAAEARFQQLRGGDHAQALTDLAEIVPAASFERVDTLFVASHTQRWGTFDPDTGAVTLHAERQPGDEDLLDLAAVHTLLNRGTVFARDAGEMPAETRDIGAILRY